MSYFEKKANVQKKQDWWHNSYTLINENNGCTNGCKAGFSEYIALEYPEGQTHDDQEGFAVISGKGWAKIGNEEIRMEPGIVAIAPAHVIHAFKRDKDVPSLEVFWFHAAVK